MVSFKFWNWQFLNVIDSIELIKEEAEKALRETIYIFLST